MSLEEIEHLKNTLPKGVFNRYDPIWRKAFIEYTSETNNKLGMGCNPCYSKVFVHFNKHDSSTRHIQTKD